MLCVVYLAVLCIRSLHVQSNCSLGCLLRLLHSSRLLAGIHILSGLQDYKTLYATMKRIADAEPRNLDTWNIGITAGDRRLLATQPPLQSCTAGNNVHVSLASLDIAWLYRLQILITFVPAHRVHALLAVNAHNGKGKTKTLLSVNLLRSFDNPL